MLELGDVTFHSEYQYVNSDGLYIGISLSLPPFDHYTDGAVVTGEYTFDVDNSFTPMTIAQESRYANYIYYAEYDYASPEEIIYLKDGKVTITQTDEGYNVRAELISEANDTLIAVYTGQINFANKYAAMLPPAIDEDKNITCAYGLLDYYNDAQYKIDIMANDPFNGTDYPSWGDMDRLNIYLIGTEDDPTGIPAGTYEVGKEGPGGVIPGEFIFDGYASSNYGSYYFFFDTYSFEETVGYFSSGTVTVERNDANYKITVDVIDANGYSIKASYEGTPELRTT